MPNTPRTQETSRTQLPTLADVARRAKVSTATVSRCLNAPDRVVEKTRKRVLDAVAELGYTPHFGAQALAAKRTNTFGAIVPTMENAIFARGLQAFQEELEQRGITLLVASSSYRQDLEEKQIRTLVARGADALLLIGQDRRPEVYEFLQQRDVSFVTAWVHKPDGPHLSIGFDNRRAMKALVRRVLDMGHRSLGYITAEIEGNDRARGRCFGVIEALEDAGLSRECLQVVTTPYSIANGAAALQRLVGGGARPTAVLCGNDVLAAGALMKAHELGIRVPDDMSITGFDDIELSQIVTPALTTVHVPHRNMGKGAAQMLIALRNGEEPGQSVELQATTQLRGSLGPVPNGGG